MTGDRTLTTTTEWEPLVRGKETALEELVETFFLAKNDLSPRSVKDYRHYLGDFIRWANHPTLGEFTDRRAARYVAEYRSRSVWAAAYACRVLKSFASWLAESGYLIGPGGGSVLAFIKEPATPREGRQPLTDKEVEAMLRAIEGSPNDLRARDRALVLLLFSCGLRLNEARELRLEDVHIERQQSWIIVRGETSKGRTTRRIRLDQLAASALHEYIEDWRPGPRSGAVFVTVRKRQAKGFTRFGFQTYAGRIRDRLEAAGIEGWTAHRLRHTWATWYHRASRESGTTLYDLQREGGWRDPTTLRRYTHDRPFEELQQMPTATSLMLRKRRAG